MKIWDIIKVDTQHGDGIEAVISSAVLKILKGANASSGWRKHLLFEEV
jgi:hypothetical protein